MDEYIKRSEVVRLIEEKIKRCDTVLETLAFASLRTKVMGLRSADVAPRADVAKEIFEELDKIMLPLLHEVSQVYIYAKLKKKYTEADPPKEKQPKNLENFEKKRLLPGDCFHGEIWCRCPYCLTGVEAHSIPKDRICRNCGKEYL